MQVIIICAPSQQKVPYSPCWLGINSIQHAAVFCRQEVQYNRMSAMTQLPLAMLCTDKGSRVETHKFWMDQVMVCARSKVRFFCSKMTEPELCEFIILFKYYYILASNVCESEIIESWHSWHKAPSTVTSHLCKWAACHNMWQFHTQWVSPSFMCS